MNLRTLAPALAVLAVAGALLVGGGDGPPAEPAPVTEALSPAPAAALHRPSSSTPAGVLIEQAPHLDALLALPPDELTALLADPVATHERVRAELEHQAEARARTELAVAGVVIDDPAALERALAAARSARPR